MFVSAHEFLVCVWELELSLMILKWSTLSPLCLDGTQFAATGTYVTHYSSPHIRTIFFTLTVTVCRHIGLGRLGFLFPGRLCDRVHSEVTLKLSDVTMFDFQRYTPTLCVLVQFVIVGLYRRPLWKPLTLLNSYLFLFQHLATQQNWFDMLYSWIFAPMSYFNIRYRPSAALFLLMNSSTNSPYTIISAWGEALLHKSHILETLMLKSVSQPVSFLLQVARFFWREQQDHWHLNKLPLLWTFSGICGGIYKNNMFEEKEKSLGYHVRMFCRSFLPASCCGWIRRVILGKQQGRAAGCWWTFVVVSRFQWPSLFRNTLSLPTPLTSRSHTEQDRKRGKFSHRTRSWAHRTELVIH